MRSWPSRRHGKPNSRRLSQARNRRCRRGLQHCLLARPILCLSDCPQRNISAAVLSRPALRSTCGVSADDDNAPSVIACGRLVCKATFSDAFEADDDLFYAMLMRWDFGAGLRTFSCAEAAAVGRRSLPGDVRSMGMRRDFPPSGDGVDAPRLVVFKVINLKPLKGEVRGADYTRWCSRGSS